MWSRKQIKKEAKGNLRKVFWKMLAVCFIVAIFFSEFGSSSLLINSYDINLQDKQVEVNRDSAIRSSDALAFVDQHVGNDAANLLVKTISESSFGYNVWSSLHAFIVDNSILMGLLFILFITLRLLYIFFIKNILLIGVDRFFIEADHDEGTKISRMIFLYHRRQVANPAKVMFMRDLFQFLWGLTIVMGPVKYYQYKMIPYLLAENPEMKWREAFAESKRMTDHEKWNLFILDCSFVGWYLLGLMTFGLLNIFFTNPYTKATTARLFVYLRGEEYAPELPEIAGRGKMTMEWLHVKADRTYSVINYILLFFTFSVVGWIWEVFYHYLGTGEIVNRGTLFGPWLPIYGTGGLIVLLFLRKWIERPILTFFIIMTSCSLLEYTTSYVLELMYGIKWWDYSGYFLNINGRICLAGSVLFGVGGCLFMYIIAPHLDDKFKKIDLKWRLVMCIVLVLLFLLDVGYSFVNPNIGRGITN